MNGRTDGRSLSVEAYCVAQKRDFSKQHVYSLVTPKTRGTFEGELTVNEVIKNNEDTEST